MALASSQLTARRARSPATIGWKGGVGRRSVTAALIVTSAIVIGCGRRGPPLTPYVRIPAAPDGIETRRTGDAVYVTLTLPALNVDMFGPADVRRVEVYGHTGLTPPPPARFLEVATLVGTIPVAPAPPPGVLVPALPEGASPFTPDGALQGAVVTLRDALDADDLVPRALPPPKGRALAPLLTTTAPAGPLRRFYMAIPFNGRGQPGPRSVIAETPLTPLPDAVAGLQVTYAADTVTVRWEPSGGLLGFLLERELPIEPPPFDEVTPRVPTSASSSSSALAGPTRYNVYRDMAPDPLALPDAGAAKVTWHVPPPAPVNPQPIRALEFSEPALVDERPRCYQVRAVRGGASSLVEGVASDRVCVTPVDVFPPAPPIGVSALAADGVISLIWEPNGDADLGGYLVLRAEAGSATLLPLTGTPIGETRFTDRMVTPGVRYVYAVRATDDRVPLPNVSAESARVEETAR
jgi:hypothetical protein